MSVEAVTQFLEKVTEDEKLQQELTSTLESQENERAAATQLGARYGYEFTQDELWQEVQKRKNQAQQRQEAGELSDEELEAVAGGGLVATPALVPVAQATVNLAESVVNSVKW